MTVVADKQDGGMQQGPRARLHERLEFRINPHAVYKRSPVQRGCQGNSPDPENPPARRTPRGPPASSDGTAAESRRLSGKIGSPVALEPVFPTSCPFASDRVVRGAPGVPGCAPAPATPGPPARALRCPVRRGIRLPAAAAPPPHPPHRWAPASIMSAASSRNPLPARPLSGGQPLPSRYLMTPAYSGSPERQSP
jgi:hypothetical protein